MKTIRDALGHSAILIYLRTHTYYTSDSGLVDTLVKIERNTAFAIPSYTTGRGMISRIAFSNQYSNNEAFASSVKCLEYNRLCWLLDVLKIN